MKKTCTCILLIMFSIASKAQSAKVVYGEIGGPGLASLNFDTRFTRQNLGLGGRIGIGGFKINDVGLLIVPVGLNYLISNDEKNCLEIGGGFTYINLSSDSENDTEQSSFENSFGHLWLGYRLQPIDQGISFRAGICPVFGSGSFIPYYAGISIGYKF